MPRDHDAQRDSSGEWPPDWKADWVEKRKKLTISRHLDMIRPLLHTQTGVLN
jgi:hypothetical protein